MLIIPYIVVAAVAILFLIVCWFMVYGFGSETEELEKTKEIVRPPRPVRRKPVPHPAVPEKTAEVANKRPVSETTQIIPIRAHSKTAVPLNDVDGATKVFDRKELEASMPEVLSSKKKTVAFETEKEPDIVTQGISLELLEERFVRHFLNQYGAVSPAVEQDTRTVTGYLIRQLGMESSEASDTLKHIMVQEALQNAQRTYVMMPNDIVLSMVSDAFCDVAKGRRSETRTALAYDALKAMPRMEESQFHALALLLLFHYSRNTDNVDVESFRKYTKKYITPFVENLPDEYSGYQQLEYIHCVSLDNKETAFGRVLHDSYPLIFAYRGCMKSELTSVKESWPENSLVPSLYNSYYKPAVVDDSLLFDFYADMGIEGEEQRGYLTKLIHSRPVDYDRKELSYILGRISPDFAKMQEAWDTSLLRRSSLTLMGMYIARSCIKATIGEEFDLSHWM